MLGFLGVNGFACGFNVDFFVPKMVLSFPLDETSLTFELFPLDIPDELVLITLLELFCCC